MFAHKTDFILLKTHATPFSLQKVASSLVKDAKPSVIESQTASKDAQVTETEMAECESKSEDIMFSEFNRHLTALNKCVSKWIAVSYSIL